MCGISGIFSFNSKIQLDELKKFNNSLIHRGPDSEGYYLSNNCNFGLANRRLSIVDLSNKANQPISFLNRYYITFNGCIYNYVEIKKELVELGYKFNTTTDTEVLLKSYVEWGEECQKKFNGDWAFAIWDDHKKEIFLSRDRFSVKPLYYFYDNKNFAFASEIKAFKNLNFPIEINSEEISELTDDLFNDNKTYLKNVYSLGGGCSLTINYKKKIEIKRWWETKDNLIKFSSNINDQIEYFKFLIEDSIKIRLRTDANFGFTISGGLDSSTLQAFTNKNLKIKTNSFFVDFPNSELSENRYYEILKKNYNNHYHYINFYNYNLDYDEICKIIEMQESFQFFACSSFLNYSEMSKKNMKVSIDGHGVDELLGGYPFIYEELINKFSFSFKNKINLKQLQKIYSEISHESTIKDQFIKKKINFKKDIYNNSKLFFKKFLYKRNIDKMKINDENINKSKLNSNDNFNDELYDTFHNKSLPIILKNFDRSSMGNSVEIRSPFLDWRIVVFLFSISSNSKIKKGFNKYLLRVSSKNILVDDIRLRKKKIGWQSPKDQLLQQNSKLFSDVFNDQKFLESNLWNGKKIREQVEKSIKEKNFLNLDNYWKYFNAYLLLKNY